MRYLNHPKKYVQYFYNTYIIPPLGISILLDLAWQNLCSNANGCLVPGRTMHPQPTLQIQSETWNNSSLSPPPSLPCCLYVRYIFPHHKTLLTRIKQSFAQNQDHPSSLELLLLGSLIDYNLCTHAPPAQSFICRHCSSLIPALHRLHSSCLRPCSAWCWESVGSGFP